MAYHPFTSKVVIFMKGRNNSGGESQNNCQFLLINRESVIPSIEIVSTSMIKEESITTPVWNPMPIKQHTFPYTHQNAQTNGCMSFDYKGKMLISDQDRVAIFDSHMKLVHVDTLANLQIHKARWLSGHMTSSRFNHGSDIYGVTHNLDRNICLYDARGGDHVIQTFWLGKENCDFILLPNGNIIAAHFGTDPFFIEIDTRKQNLTFSLTPDINQIDLYGQYSTFIHVPDTANEFVAYGRYFLATLHLNRNQNYKK